jgi:RND family efflux transporter MFP subunit
MTEQRHASLGLHPIHAEGDASHDAAEALRRHQVTRRMRNVAIVVAVVLVAGAARTMVSRAANARALDAGVAEHSAVYVKTSLPKAADSGQTIALPGTLQGAVQAPIAARASGYLKRWTKDIGSHVEKGELLAEIEAPELDEQVRQALARRDQAASSLALAQSTVERWESLRKKDVVAQQDLDERRSALVQARANLAAADADLQRLKQLEDFKRVTAPFAGVITRRNVDVGDLIDTSGKALFMLSQADPLRLYVSVPQAYAQLVKPGMPVTVTQSELRGRTFKGEVTRTSASIDAATRTMQAEVSLPNRDGALLPGAYVTVALPLPASQGLTVPVNALLFRSEGTRVAVVDGGGRVTLHPVGLGRDDGRNVEVTAGLQASDRIVLNPPDSLVDGDVVALAQPPAASEAAK